MAAKTMRRHALAPLLLAGGLACAGTPMEDQVANAPMPHTQLGAGVALKVHYVRLAGKLDEQVQISQLVKGMKENLAYCVEGRRQLGLPARMPARLPQYSHPVHTDTYWAHNRMITYSRRYAMAVNEDCSITEGEILTAQLESSKGSCTINLTERTTEGECNPTVHAAAPPVKGPKSGVDLQSQMALLASDPRTAAAAAQLRQMAGHAARTGRKKSILGIECEVSSAPAALPGSSCRAIGGSFEPFHGVILESDAQGMINGTAVDAKLDAQVNATIFAPHIGWAIK